MSININIEKLKKDITSEDILASLFYYAVFGEKISQNDLERFKWHGIYAKDEKQTSFSLKIPLNLGELNLSQLESILNNPMILRIHRSYLLNRNMISSFKKSKKGYDVIVQNRV